MYVFAFDRDWTVDLNPCPGRDAVPLSWVKFLDNETDHAVYATGNQDLVGEAGIHGVVDIVGRHPTADWDDCLGEKKRNGRYESFPKRRTRLEMLEDIHPDAEGYIVVDDLDLSDVDNWDHYVAWEFMPAARDGEIVDDLPPRDVVLKHYTDDRQHPETPPQP